MIPPQSRTSSDFVAPETWLREGTVDPASVTTSSVTQEHRGIRFHRTSGFRWGSKILLGSLNSHPYVQFVISSGSGLFLIFFGSEPGEGGMKEQIALLGIILLISTAYAISAAKRFVFWAEAFFVFVWVTVFLWARSSKKS
jgi:hypothetical protein